MYNEYIQKFKKIARGSGYKRQSLIEEFKRWLNKELRRKLAESSPSSIEEWQERSVRLDRNQRQRRGQQGGTWYIHWKMHCKKEDLEEDYMEREKDKSCRRQRFRTSEKDIKIGISIGGLKLDQGQWQQMEERGVDLEFVSTAGDLGIWLKIIEVEDRELGREGESIKEASHQKRMEVSRLPATFP